MMSKCDVKRYVLPKALSTAARPILMKNLIFSKKYFVISFAQRSQLQFSWSFRNWQKMGSLLSTKSPITNLCSFPSRKFWLGLSAANHLGSWFHCRTANFNETNIHHGRCQTIIHCAKEVHFSRRSKIGYLQWRVYIYQLYEGMSNQEEYEILQVCATVLQIFKLVSVKQKLIQRS